MSTPTRASVNDLPPYSFGDNEMPNADRIIQLAQNELGVGPSPMAIEAAAKTLTSFNRYSDMDHANLRQAIADVHGLDVDCIVCGAGSMELLSLLATAFTDSGSEVVVSELGYKFFQVLCSVAGAKIKTVPEPDMCVDVNGLIVAVTDVTRMVFVVDPSNPTGSRLKSGELRRLRDALPEHVLLVLDCAYAEFVSDPAFETGFGMVDSGDNIVVLRTFSKAYGLAGMRIGWLYGPTYVGDAIAKIRSPNSITTTSLAAAEAAMRDREHLDQVTADINDLREIFRRKAQSIGLTALPSDGNFVMIECPKDSPLIAGDLYRALRQEGIITRPMGSYNLQNHLRVTIGSTEEMEILGVKLKRVFDLNG